MSEKDLKKFIHKIKQLNDMVESIKTNPKRRELLVACNDHEEVVKLAEEWGYEIGNRWGE